MSLNEKFGYGGSSVHKVQVHGAPDASMLQKLLSDLSTSAPGTQCEVSWQSGNSSYALTLNHSRQAARANWKLYSGKGLQPKLVWEQTTNDVHVVHKLVLSEMQRLPRSTQTEIKLSAIREAAALQEERRSININNNLSGKLRQLFIGAQEDLVAEITSSSLPAVKAPSPEKSKALTRRGVEHIDLTPGRQLLQQLFVNRFGIFSYPTFLFFLEREFYEAIENNSPITLVIFTVANISFLQNLNSLPGPILQEITKRMKNTQRKTDIFTQIDGNKFAVLLPDTNTTGGKSFVSRVEKVLLKTALSPALRDTDLKLNFGLASLGKHCKNLPALLSLAETALEKAQLLGNNTVCDQDILSHPDVNLEAFSRKAVDLIATRQLVAQLVSEGIFTYPAFLAFLEHEYYRCARNKRELLVMLFKVRVYEETFDDVANMLPDAAYYEVIRRIGTLVTKRDIFAHYGQGNFVIMRSNTSAIQMQNFARRAVQAITSDAWLTPECAAASLRVRTEIYTVRASRIAPHLLDLIPAA